MTGSSDDRPEVEASAVDQVAPLQSAPPEATEVPDEARKRLPVGAYLAIGWLVFIIGAAIFADLLPLHDPAAEVASLPRLAPGQEGLILGADNGSRDMLSRTIYGARSSLMISVGAVSIGFVVGGLLGLLGGYFRNWIGKVLTSLFDILLAIPALVLALSLVSVLKGGGVEDPDAFRLAPIWILIISLGIVSIPLLARITRGNTMAWAQREFVTAARAQGATHPRILFREILPNVLPAMAYIAILGIAIAIVAEGGLAILGASLDPPTPSWGVMINDGRSYMRDAPFIMFVPIVATFLTVMSLNYLGDLVRDRFDVRESAL
ncbi:MAG: ABC transporter permease [Microthrixaceae bacterium]|nr:ABC transporter permease [Acidimicrobiales bacterium]MCB9405101.1 ABC transporter permease [Microthrixaceae bacterium]